MHLLLAHSNSIVVATSRQHTPVYHIAMCCINAHAGVRLTHPVLYSVGVYTDTPTTCMPSDQNNCRLATYTLHVMHHAQFTLRVPDRPVALLAYLASAPTHIHKARACMYTNIHIQVGE